MQCACAILPCGLPRFTIFFHIFSKTALFFEKKGTEHKMSVLIFATNFATFLILRRNERVKIKMCIGLHVKYPLIFFDFNET